MPTLTQADAPNSSEEPPQITVDWGGVIALPTAASIRVTVAESGVFELAQFRSPQGDRAAPGSRTLLGSFISADDASLTLHVIEGAEKGAWTLPRGAIAQVEIGRLERDSRKEGIIAGAAAIAGGAALGYAYGASTESSEKSAMAAVGALFVGAPLAVLFIWRDAATLSFESTSTVYERENDSGEFELEFSEDSPFLSLELRSFLHKLQQRSR